MSDTNEKTEYRTQKSPKGRGLLRPTGRVLIGLAVQIADMVFVRHSTLADKRTS